MRFPKNHGTGATAALPRVPSLPKPNSSRQKRSTHSRQKTDQSLGAGQQVKATDRRQNKENAEGLESVSSIKFRELGLRSSFKPSYLNPDRPPC